MCGSPVTTFLDLAFVGSMQPLLTAFVSAFVSDSFLLSALPLASPTSKRLALIRNQLVSNSTGFEFAWMDSNSAGLEFAWMDSNSAGLEHKRDPSSTGLEFAWILAKIDFEATCVDSKSVGFEFNGVWRGGSG